MFWATLEFCIPLTETLFDRLSSTVAADNGTVSNHRVAARKTKDLKFGVTRKDTMCKEA